MKLYNVVFREIIRNKKTDKVSFDSGTVCIVPSRRLAKWLMQKHCDHRETQYGSIAHVESLKDAIWTKTEKTIPSEEKECTIIYEMYCG